MKLYLAARFSRQEEMREIRDQLKAMGHEVTSRWIDFPKDFASTSEEEKQRCAEQDIADIDLAKCFVYFSEERKTEGRAIEFGYAYAKMKVIILVGPMTSVFHYLPGAIDYQVNDLDELIRFLEEEF